MHQQTAGIVWIYIKKENRSRGFNQLELIYKTTTIGLKKYLDTTN